jgi:hypothetical protein
MIMPNKDETGTVKYVARDAIHGGSGADGDVPTSSPTAVSAEAAQTIVKSLTISVEGCLDGVTVPDVDIKDPDAPIITRECRQLAGQGEVSTDSVAGDDASNVKPVSHLDETALGSPQPDTPNSGGPPPIDLEQAEQEPVPEEGAAVQTLVAFVHRQYEAERVLGIRSGRAQHRIGLALVRLRATIPHGQWRALFTEHGRPGKYFEFTAKTAANYMRLTDLPPERIENTPVTELYESLGIVPDRKNVILEEVLNRIDGFSEYLGDRLSKKLGRFLLNTKRPDVLEAGNEVVQHLKDLAKQAVEVANTLEEQIDARNN